MRRALREWIGEPLGAALAEPFAREVADVNRRRLRILGPIMVLLHVAHVAHFWIPANERATLPANVIRWRDSLVGAHGAMVIVALGLAWVAYRARRPRVLALLGPVAGAAYLVHGAICTGLDQLVVTNVTAYVGYCYGVAVVLILTPAASAVAYTIGATALGAMMLLLQSSGRALFASLPNCVTLTIVGFAFSWLLYAARRREFGQRATIARQQGEMAALNADLERRVREQVAEIVARAADVERLNAQLQAQVRERSNELSLALARLAQHGPIVQTLTRGTVIDDRFVIEELLGEGGMGAVYAGFDRTSRARVAIKVIQAASSQQLDALRRFIREAGTAANVTHPAVVRTLHIDTTDDGLLFQVQELVEGETLTGRLAEPWPAPHAARLIAVLCDALAAAHAKSVVHRDVKPDNVMLTATAPGLKLLDFGIAKLYDAVSRSEATTHAGEVLGTPAYMAPEQVAGDGEVTDRADVYAVGVILFRLLTARFPFEAGTAQELMMRQVVAAAPDVRRFDASIPDVLAGAIERCLAKAPAARPSAAALARELAAWADAEGAPALETLTRPSVSTARPSSHENTVYGLKRARPRARF